MSQEAGSEQCPDWVFQYFFVPNAPTIPGPQHPVKSSEISELGFTHLSICSVFPNLFISLILLHLLIEHDFILVSDPPLLLRCNGIGVYNVSRRQLTVKPTDKSSNGAITVFQGRDHPPEICHKSPIRCSQGSACTTHWTMALKL